MILPARSEAQSGLLRKRITACIECSYHEYGEVMPEPAARSSSSQLMCLFPREVRHTFLFPTSEKRIERRIISHSPQSLVRKSTHSLTVLLRRHRRGRAPSWAFDSVLSVRPPWFSIFFYESGFLKVCSPCIRRVAFLILAVFPSFSCNIPSGDRRRSGFQKIYYRNFFFVSLPQSRDRTWCPVA